MPIKLPNYLSIVIQLLPYLFYRKIIIIIINWSLHLLWERILRGDGCVFQEFFQGIGDRWSSPSMGDRYYHHFLKLYLLLLGLTRIRLSRLGARRGRFLLHVHRNLWDIHDIQQFEGILKYLDHSYFPSFFIQHWRTYYNICIFIIMSFRIFSAFCIFLYIGYLSNSCSDNLDMFFLVTNSEVFLSLLGIPWEVLSAGSKKKKFFLKVYEV